MSEFHFLRPWWLVALLPLALLAWRLWVATDTKRPWRRVIAPHLLPHLLVGADQVPRNSPIVWFIVGGLVGTFALAGPAWQREPAPFADDTTALVIVLKVTPSMQTEDVQPTRLARAVQKIHDLLALRPGSKSALIAYSGSAHTVMPLTTDAAIIESFAADLTPSVMPTEGDVAAAALKSANQIIAQSGQRGWVVWMADSAAPDQTAGFTEYRQRRFAPVSVLAVAGAGPELDSLRMAATALGAELVNVTPDNADVKRLSGNARFSPAVDGTGEHWRDGGYWLVPVLAAFALLWFRPGWVVQTGAEA